MTQFVTYFGIIIIIFIAYLMYKQWSNRRKVEKNHMCIVVTKSNDLMIEMWPKAEGEIIAPPHKEFKDNERHSRTYYYKRPFSLKTKYPPFAGFPMNFAQVDAHASIYEEGSAEPILPSNEETALSPERINIVGGTRIARDLVGGLGRLLQGQQGEGTGLSFGKNKLLVQIVVVVIGLAIMIAGYAGFQMIQFIPYAMDWMSKR